MFEAHDAVVDVFNAGRDVLDHRAAAVTGKNHVVQTEERIVCCGRFRTETVETGTADRAAFQHVEEGFDVIQEAVTAASDLEQEKLMQRLNWVSVCGNLGPSLGLLGTVQGMILTFQALAQGGAGDAAALANSIGQALWTTAGGLIVSIPSITMFYVLRNKMNRLVLRMTAVTMEFLNGLRNVSVEEGAAEAAQ